MKKIIIYFSIVLLFCTCKEQSPSRPLGKPKLVIGIVVDQMRYDYLTRFDAKYGEGGFKRLIHKGYNFKNNHFNYIPTYTGPGHASVYTGTTPKYHGIISNVWYDKKSKESVYCVSDKNYSPIGTEDEYSRVSPMRMIATTITDELSKFTQGRSKIIGIALKDRAAVLPAGHSADAAYWFQGKDEGQWVSSSFYMDSLPEWVTSFNMSDRASAYLKPWETYYPIATYTESGSDLNNFEMGFHGKETATFPYDLALLKSKNKGYDILKSTPYGNNLTTDFAIACITGEKLGQRDETDFLALSYSSTDYIGHNFGVNSKEIEDTYIRLDKDIERLLIVLDEKIGRGEYLVFLTADHGAVHVPAYLQSIDEPAGYFDQEGFEKQINEFSIAHYGTTELIESISNNQIFLSRKVLDEKKIDLNQVSKNFVNELIRYRDIDRAYTREAMVNEPFKEGVDAKLQRGFNQKRSGDVLYTFSPAVISYPKKGSTHGSGFSYDTHVPLIFYGKGIIRGESKEKTAITDLAPTLSSLLKISFPNSTIGRPLNFVPNE